MPERRKVRPEGGARTGNETAAAREPPQGTRPPPQAPGNATVNAKGENPPPSEPLVAAYEAGRLWNQLAWYAPQAWLRGSARDCKRTCQTFQELARKVRECVPVAERDQLQRFVQERLAEWEACYGSLWRAEDLGEANERLNAQYGCADDFDAEREAELSRLLVTVDGLLARTQEGITAKLDDTQKLAWGLGVCTDQGLCPPRVFRHLLCPGAEQALPPSGVTNPLLLATGPGLAAKPREPENLLADRSLDPGQIPPEASWGGDIRQRWAELAMPADLLSGAARPALAWSPQVMRELVGRVDDAARRGLAALRPPASGSDLNRAVTAPDGCAQERLRTVVRSGGPKPHWDRDARVLSYEGVECKRYDRAAPQQERVLASFEELDWPKGIDDPLPPGKLADTIKDLQKAVRQSPITFERDGTGRGIVWRRREAD
jgi:hypothetical protein